MKGLSIRSPRNSRLEAREFVETEFFGRASELAALSALLDEGTRLITVVGPPGVGKSRLVIEARNAAEEFAGDWLFVSLEGVSSEQRFLERLGAALGSSSARAVRPTALAAEVAKRGPTCVVLDGLEHLAGAAAETVHTLLRSAPDLRLIVTSRLRSEEQGEKCLELGPLGGTEILSREHPAVLLFRDRARAVAHDFDVAPHEEIIAQICTELDCIPDALELAAAKTRLLGLGELKTHLEETIRQLGTTSSLAESVASSWELLEPWEQRALIQCSVFEGSFNTAAADAVIDVKPRTTLEALDQLRRHSLLQSERGGETTRFRVLGIVRDFATGRAVDCVVADARARHHSYFFAQSAAWSAQLVNKETADAAKASVRDNLDNLRVIQKLALSSQREREANVVARLIVEAVLESGPYDTARSVMEGLLAGTGSSGNVPERAGALVSYGQLELKAEQFEKSIEVFRAALELSAELRDSQLIATAFVGLGRAQTGFGDVEAARSSYAKALSLVPESSPIAARARFRSSALCLWSSRRVDITDVHRSAIRLFEKLGDNAGLIEARTSLAWALYMLGDLPGARHYYNEALVALGVSGDVSSATLTQLLLGCVHLESEELSTATSHLQEALRLARSNGLRNHEAMALSWLGVIHAIRGEHAEARVSGLKALRLFDSVSGTMSRVLARANLANMLAMAMLPNEAVVWLDEAAYLIKASTGPIKRHLESFLLPYRGQVAAAFATTETPAERDHLESARQCLRAHRLASGDAPVHYYTRLAAQGLERLLGRWDASQPAPVLQVEADGKWFQLGMTDRIDIASSSALTRILSGLVKAHRIAKPMSVSELFEVGWPNERITATAAAARVYTALSTLRRLGLRDVMLRSRDGYALDPGVEISDVDSTNSIG